MRRPLAAARPPSKVVDWRNRRKAAPQNREKYAMPLVVVRHKVKDYATWKKAFDGHAEAQKAAGLSNPRVYRSADDRNEAVILFDTSDIAAAKKFAASPDLKSTMQAAGVTDQPTIYLLEEAR
jgi:hypothetical protein